MKKYYELILDGNDKIGGSLYAPPQWPYPISRDGIEVKNWKSLILELKNGDYCPFHTCNKGANLVSKELKDLLESFLDNNHEIDFFPVQVTSAQYGDRVYYIMHFRKIYDVADRKNSIYASSGREVSDITILRLDPEKVKDLKVFNSSSAINSVFVTSEIRKAIKKAGLEKGAYFVPVYCSD